MPACAAVEVRLHHLTTEAESNACEWEWRVCSQAVLTYAFIPASLANTAELWVICPKSVVCCLKSLPLNPNLELLLVSRSPQVWASGALGADSLGGRRICLAVRVGDKKLQLNSDSSPTLRKHCTRVTVLRTIAVGHGAKRKSRSNPSHFDSARVRRAQFNFNGCQPEIMPLSLAGILYRPLGLSLSLGTSRHPRPFDRSFIIKESSSPALIHASSHGVCLIAWAGLSNG